MQAMLTERAGQATKGKGMTDDVIIKPFAAVLSEAGECSG
jgi:hypothetical protein